jgi:hypothetical protein
VVDFLAVQISFLCYHCLLEGFLSGLFAVMTMVYCCFLWGLLSMTKLSLGSLWQRSNPRGLIYEPNLNLSILTEAYISLVAGTSLIDSGGKLKVIS